MKNVRLFLVGIALAMLSACSSTEKQTDAASEPVDTQVIGQVLVKRDKKGNPVELSSTASAAIVAADGRAQDAAAQLAATRARQNIAAFLDTHVSSLRITKSDTDSGVISDRTTETVTERTSALLRGVVIHTVVEGDRVFATAKVEFVNVPVARKFRNEMRK